MNYSGLAKTCRIKLKFKSVMKIGDYVVVERIGYGSTSSVFKVKKDEDFYAMKCVTSEYFPSANEESKFLQTVKHPNIIPVKQIFMFKNENNEDRFCIVFPLAELNLNDIKSRIWSLVPIEKRWEWFLNLLDGLIEMKKYGYFHGDIHPKNILITKGKAMWCDFGLSCKYKQGVRYSYGSFPYCSPAAFLQNGWFHVPSTDPQDLLNITHAGQVLTLCHEGRLIIPLIEEETPYEGDVFSLGLLLSYLFCVEKRNFLQTNTHKSDVNDVRENMWRYVMYPEAYWNLLTIPYHSQIEPIIKRCCEINPKNRITLEECKEMCANVFL